MPADKIDTQAVLAAFGIFNINFFTGLNAAAVIIINNPNTHGIKTNISNLLHCLDIFNE